MKQADSRVWIALVVTLLFWGSAFAGIRVALAAYSPGHLALLRFLIASAVLGLYALVTRMPLPQLRDVPAIIGLGFIGITLYHLLLNYGEVTVTAGAASLLIALAPVFMALLALFLLGERLTLWGWIGMVISFAGGAFISLGQGQDVRFEPGALLILLAAVATSLYNVLQKPQLKKYGALQFTACAIWSGTLFMLPYLPGLGQAVRSAPLDATLAVVYLGIFPAALAYATWTYLLSRVPASVVGSYIYLIPVLATLVAWVWLREIPTFISLVGGGLSLFGVVLVNTRGSAGKQ